MPQSAGDQISQLMALLSVVLMWLQILDVGCTSVFVPQDVGVFEVYWRCIGGVQIGLESDIFVDIFLGNQDFCPD